MQPAPSGGLLGPGEREPGLLEATLEHRDAVIAPELLAAENADRHAEDLIGCGLLLRSLIVALSLAVEIGAVIFAGQTELIHEFGHGLDLIDRELTLEEQLI